jgi:hypothetical protein
MRDPLFVRARRFVPELTAEHAGSRQSRPESALDHRIPPPDGRFVKEIAGFPGNAFEIHDVGPRMLATDCSPLPMAASFHFATRALYAPAYI